MIINKYIFILLFLVQ